VADDTHDLKPGYVLGRLAPGSDPSRRGSLAREAAAQSREGPIGCSQAATASGTAFARRSAAAVASLPATTARRSAGIGRGLKPDDPVQIEIDYTIKKVKRR
jgi:hypothetical protein